MKQKTLDAKKIPERLFLGSVLLETEVTDGYISAVTLHTDQGPLRVQKQETYSAQLRFTVPDIEIKKMWEIKGELRGLPFVFSFEEEDKAKDKKDQLDGMNSREDGYKCEIKELDITEGSVGLTSGARYCGDSSDLSKLFSGK